MGELGQDEDAATADLDPSLEKQLEGLRIELRGEVAPVEGRASALFEPLMRETVAPAPAEENDRIRKAYGIMESGRL